MKPVLITPPASDIVSLEDFSLHGRLPDPPTGEDALLGAFLDAAVDHLDGYAGILGRCLMNQVWAVPFCDWAKRLRLPFPDVSAAVVTYVDGDDAEVTVDVALYEIVEDHRGAYIAFKDAFTKPGLTDDLDYPITVTITAGYGAADDVPPAIKQAIKLLAAHYYEHREASLIGVNAAAIPFGVLAMIAPYRRMSL